MRAIKLSHGRGGAFVLLVCALLIYEVMLADRRPFLHSAFCFLQKRQGFKIDRDYVNMIPNMNQRVFVHAILVGLALSSACGLKVSTVRYDEERVVAYAATDRFVSLFNDRKFEEIWAMTDERAKATKSKTALIAMLSGLRDDLGKIAVLERDDSLGKPGDGYVEITLQFKAKFERSEARMSFVWYVTKDKVALFSIAIG